MSANKLTSEAEYVGYNGAAVFNQTGGTNTITGGNGIYLGENSGSTGTYLLSAAGSLSPASEVRASG